MNHSDLASTHKKNLIVTKVGDETVVFDPDTNNASCLNSLMTRVWDACDGKSNIQSILETIRNDGNQETTEQDIQIAFQQLDQAALLERPSAYESNRPKRLNRREMLRLLGTRTAAVLPIVSTIEIQPAIAAASQILGPGDSCSRSNGTSNLCGPGLVCCGRNGNTPNGTCQSTFSCPPGHRIP